MDATENAFGEYVRADSGSSMESLDLEVEKLHIGRYGNHLGGEYENVRTNTNHVKGMSERPTRAKTLNELQLDQLGICEGVDSSDDEDGSGVRMSGAASTPAPVGRLLNPPAPEGEPGKTTYAELRARVRSMPLAFSGVSAVPDVLSSPVSSEEDNATRLNRAASCCPLNGLRRSRCLRLNFDQLRPSQDFLLKDDMMCTARKRADDLTREISELRPYLYIGDVKAAQSLCALKAKGVTHVINLAGATCRNFGTNEFSYLTLTPADCASEDLSCLFLPIAAFIDSARAVGGKVLIHCYRGISRSCACAISYIMLDEGMSFAQAWGDLLRVRPVASPNKGFMNALVALERFQRLGVESPRIWRMEVQQGYIAVMKRLDTIPMSDFISEQVLVYEKPNRRGMEVYRGDSVSDAWWNVIAPVLDRFAEQLERNRLLYPREIGDGSHIEVDSVDENQMLQWQRCH